jgi:hypothetical protein
LADFVPDSGAACSLTCGGVTILLTSDTGISSYVCLAKLNNR